MAEAVSSKDNLRSLLECCICTEKFKDPRILPCIHTFCLKCLEQTGKGKSPGASMPCPLCRTEFRIPASGLVGIQKNFFMEQLLSMYHLSKPEAKGDPCDACLENLDNQDEEVAVARMFCMECNQKLCDLCFKWHTRTKATKNHELIELGNKDQICHVSRNLTRSLCVFHENKPIEMYCLDCSETICMICYAEKHHGHKCSGVGKVGDGFRLQLESCIANISKCSSGSEDEVNKLDELNHSISNQVSNLGEFILRRAAKIKSTVDEHANKLLLELNSMKSRNLKEIENRSEEVRRYLAMLESYERYAKEIIGKGSAVEICRNFQEMKTRACELERNFNTVVPGSNPPNARFTILTSSHFEDFLGGCENLIGELVTENASRDTKEDILILSSAIKSDNSNSNVSQNQPHTNVRGCSRVNVDEQLAPETKNLQFPRQNDLLDGKHRICIDSHLAKTFTIKQAAGEITGVTWLENKIYVVCRDSKKVLAFQDHAPFRELVEQGVGIEEMKQLYDMTASRHSRSIYIVDSGNRSLWKIRVATKEVEKGVAHGGEPMGISIGTSGDLLVMLLMNEKFYLVILNSSNFQQKMTIPLPIDMNYPSNAVQLLNGNFIVSHKNDRFPGSGYLISEFSAAGKEFIRTFDPSVSVDLRQLEGWWPYHLAIDAEDGLFVADNSADGHGMLLLDSYLTDYRTLVSGDGHTIVDPVRLCYLPDRKQLIVGQWSQSVGSARVTVIDLSPNTKV